MLVKASVSIIIGIRFYNTLFPPSAHCRYCHPEEACDFIYPQFASGPSSYISGLELVAVGNPHNGSSVDPVTLAGFITTVVEYGRNF